MDCKQCDKVLEELEHIDDEAEDAGIDFIKIDDKEFARQMGVYALPAVVFFRHGHLEPVIYAGDLKNEERLLEWLLLQKDPTTDIIEEFEDEELVECIRQKEFVAVYFCQFRWIFIEILCAEQLNWRFLFWIALNADSQQQDCDDCMRILEELENIDDDTDRHGIHFVKTQDLNIATNFGVTEFPAVIYFENQVPSIYEGKNAVNKLCSWLTVRMQNMGKVKTI